MISFIKQGARPGREARRRVSVGPALTHGARSDTVQKNFMEPPCCGPITHMHRHLDLMHVMSWIGHSKHNFGAEGDSVLGTRTAKAKDR